MVAEHYLVACAYANWPCESTWNKRHSMGVRKAWGARKAWGVRKAERLPKALVFCIKLVGSLGALPIFRDKYTNVSEPRKITLSNKPFVLLQQTHTAPH
tara:strand:+ start:1278 stop:1574 length:297 start_codon:yes stop_codon:yes gene_type:complete